MPPRQPTTSRFVPRPGRGWAIAIALALLGCSQALPTGPAGETAPLAGLAQFPEALVSSGQVLPTGIGSVIQAGPSGYRLQHAGHGHGLAELPVSGATVVLRDPATRQPLPGLTPVRTDERGRFRFEAAPTTANHLIEVVFLAADGKRAHRLLSLGRGGGDVRVSWRSSAAVAKWLQTPGRDWQAIDAAALALEEAAQGAALEALPESARQGFLDTLLGAAATALGPDGPSAEALPLPVLSASPSPVPSLLPSPVASTLGQVTGEVRDTVETTTDTVGDTVETVGDKVETTSGDVDQATDPVDEVVETTTDTVGDLLAPLPSPSGLGLL